jgi:hypothetical protein
MARRSVPHQLRHLAIRPVQSHRPSNTDDPLCAIVAAGTGRSSRTLISEEGTGCSSAIMRSFNRVIGIFSIDLGLRSGNRRKARSICKIIGRSAKKLD